MTKVLGKGSITPVTENVREGVPPPPSQKAAGQKVNGKKITEKGGEKWMARIGNL